MSADEPRRWLESDGLDETLRADLEAAAEDDVGYDVDAAVARFEATLVRGGPPGDGAGGAGTGGTGPAVAAGGSAAGKGLALVVSMAVIVGGAIAWSVADRGSRAASAPVVAEREPRAREDPTPAAAPATTSTSAPSHPAVSPAPVPTPSPGSSPAPASTPAADAEATPPPEPRPSPDPSRPRHARSTPRSSTPTTDPAPSIDDDRLRREMQATDRARQALASDPSRALALLRKADAEFPDGLFAEDREGIAILALLALGRAAEGRRRAEAFLRAHPRSSHADRIRAALDEHEEP